MPRPLATYEDCRRHFEQALESQRGIILRFATSTQAVTHRKRLHELRAALRRQSAQMHPSSSPLHGTCEFDTLVCQIPKDEPNIIRIVPFAAAQPSEIEEL